MKKIIILFNILFNEYNKKKSDTLINILQKILDEFGTRLRFSSY